MRARVAVNVDAVNENPVAFANVKGNVKLAGARVFLQIRHHVDKGKALLAQLVGNRINRFFNEFGIVPIAFFEQNFVIQRFDLNIGNLRINRNIVNLVTLALVNDKSQHKRLFVGTEFGNRRNDAEIGIAAFQIKAAQKLLVIIGLFRIIVFGA